MHGGDLGALLWRGVLTHEFLSPLLERALPGLGLVLVFGESAKEFFELLAFGELEVVSLGHRAEQHDRAVEVLEVLRGSRRSFLPVAHVVLLWRAFS